VQNYFQFRTVGWYKNW